MSDVSTIAKLKELIGTLPDMNPPMYGKLQATMKQLLKAAQKVPSCQLAQLGHAGMILKPAIYALNKPVAWVNPIDPGDQPQYPRHQLGDSWVCQDRSTE